MKGLYIHLPFCKSKCKYCGFYSICNYDEGLINKYLNQIITILDTFCIKNFSTVYIGGGTPSVVNYKIFDRFLSNLFKRINVDNIVELTVEANPESVNEDFLKILNDYCISRISLGVQSMDEDVLKYLGRIHKVVDIQNAVKSIREILPHTTLNLDLIYDIPDVNKNIIINSLNDAVSLNPEHISAYSYSFDTNFLSPEKEVQDSQFLVIKKLLDDKGYKKYEISNFAKEGFESIHNKIYWQMKEYLGVGSGASSMFYQGDSRVRFSFPKDIDKFLKNPHIIDFEIVTEKDELLKEDLIFGLRLMKGVKVNLLFERYGKLVEKFIKKCDKLFTEKFLYFEGENVCLTEKGELFLDYVQQFLWEL